MLGWQQASWSYQRDKEKGSQRSGRGERKWEEEPRPRVSFQVLGPVTTAFCRESGRGESQSHSGPSLRDH